MHYRAGLIWGEIYGKCEVSRDAEHLVRVTPFLEFGIGYLELNTVATSNLLVDSYVAGTASSVRAQAHTKCNVRTSLNRKSHHKPIGDRHWIRQRRVDVELGTIRSIETGNVEADSGRVGLKNTSHI